LLAAEFPLPNDILPDRIGSYRFFLFHEEEQEVDEEVKSFWPLRCE
jgi:hypothetical protein